MHKIGYRNPSKSEIIGRCGGDEKDEIFFPDCLEPVCNLSILNRPRVFLFNILSLRPSCDCFKHKHYQMSVRMTVLNINIIK